VRDAQLRVFLTSLLLVLTSCGSIALREDSGPSFASLRARPETAPASGIAGELVVQDADTPAPTGDGDGQVQGQGDGNADEDEDDPITFDEEDTPEEDTGAEGAAGSNPLAAVSNVDVIANYLNLKHGDEAWDYYLKGSTMLQPRLKLTYELHYGRSNVTGSNERAWDFASVKPIWFVKDVEIDETWGMRIAAGFEYFKDFGHRDKGIGSGTNQIAPLLGFAFMNRKDKTVLIPLVQHFEDVGSGPQVQTTAFRLIALQPLEDGAWLKGDVKVPRDWENNSWPATVEGELGQMLNQRVGLFLQTQAGVGGDAPYDWGGALGTRIRF